MSFTQKAAEFVAKILPDKAADPLLDGRRVAGRALARVDGIAKVTGTAQFTADISFSELAHASLVCSTIALGRIARIDLTALVRAPGVISVMTHENAPKMTEAPLLLDMKGASFSRLPVMQDDRVRWNGEPVAVVVAQTKEQADYAASLVRVEYEAHDARTAFDAEDAEPPADVLGQPAALSKGDATAALARAHVSIDRIYRTPRHSHAAIEPHATVAAWHDDERLTVHDASQAVTQTRATLSRVFGIKPANVRVVSSFVGGAFGNKMVWNHQLLCVAAAKLAKRPVRLMLSRADVFHTTGGRTQTEQRVALGAHPDGSLAALIHEGVSTTGRKNGFAEQFTFPARHLYAAESYRIAQRVQELDQVPNASMRAPGESVGSFALESALDELAAALHLDPIALRRRLEPSRDPTKGTAFSSRHVLEAYAHGAERFGWRDRSPRPRSRREGEWWVGHGVATATYPYQRFPGGKASVRLTADGRAVVASAAHEMGMETATVQAQLAAERLGLPADRVTFVYGDSDLPAGVPAGGSAQTASITAAVANAADKLVKKLLRLAGNDSPLAGASAGDVEMRDGGLYRRGEAAGESYTSILSRAARSEIAAEGSGGLPFEMMKYAMHSYGAQFCEVRVNEETGEVRVSRWLGVFDTGRVFNPRTAAGQFRGGIVMGIGSALMEETLFDERLGRVVNASLAEYHVPVNADIAAIDVEWLDIPDPHAPMGGRGLGEIGIAGVAAAVANAVYNATGKRIRDLPITLDKVLHAPIERADLRM